DRSVRPLWLRHGHRGDRRRRARRHGHPRGGRRRRRARPAGDRRRTAVGEGRTARDRRHRRRPQGRPSERGARRVAAPRAAQPARLPVGPRLTCQLVEGAGVGRALGGRRGVLRSAVTPWEVSQPMYLDDTQVESNWDPWSSIPPEYNLGEALTRAQVEAGRGGKVALFWENASQANRSISYSDLDAVTSRLASSLARLRLKR